MNEVEARKVAEVKALKEILKGDFRAEKRMGVYYDRVEGYQNMFQVFFDPRRYKVCLHDKLVEIIGGASKVVDQAEGSEYRFYEKGWKNKHCFSFKFGDESSAQLNMLRFVKWVDDSVKQVIEEYKAKQAAEQSQEKIEEVADEEKPKKRSRKKKSEEAAPAEKKTPRKRTKAKKESEEKTA